MTKTSAQDWLEAGLLLLGKSGAAVLTIDGLAAGLGMSKGSFYHHFQNFDDFKARMLAFWEEANTSRIIEVMDQAGTPQARYAALLKTPTRFSDEVEVAIRAWALQDKTVRAFQQRVDQRRIDSVEVIFTGLLGDAEQGRVMAQMMYAIYVGCMQVVPPIQGKSLANVFTEFQNLFESQGRAES